MFVPLFHHMPFMFFQIWGWFWKQKSVSVLCCDSLVVWGVNPTCSIWQLCRREPGPGNTVARQMSEHISVSSHQLWAQSHFPCRGRLPASHSGGSGFPLFSVWWKTLLRCQWVSEVNRRVKHSGLKLFTDIISYSLWCAWLRLTIV